LAGKGATRWSIWAAVALALVAFAVYGTFRSKYGVGADSYGYYSLSLLFEQGRLSLPVGLDPERFRSVAPLGYVAKHGRVLPTYSPGYPFLMLALRPLGLDLFVTPLLGAASIVLLHLLCLRFVSPPTALFFAALWAVSPIGVWASTALMSDGVATFFALLALLLYTRQRFGQAGLVVGLSLAVRPANALMFFVMAAALCLRPRELLRFGALFALGVAPIAWYDEVQFGAPTRTGYGSMASGFRTDVFGHHAWFYLRYTLVVLSPLVLLALVPLATAFRRHAFWLAWFLAFWLFYSFYWPGADAWWYTRFLLPAYPALLVLAAVGTETSVRWLRGRLAARARLLPPALALVAAAVLAGLLAFGARHHLFEADKAASQVRDCQAIRAAVAPEAVVGSVEFSGSLRLYGGLETFRWDHETAVETIHHVLGLGRPVYVVVEPWHWEHELLLELQEHFALEKALPLTAWADTFLWRVTPRAG
jgi:hypothetical protein